MCNKAVHKDRVNRVVKGLKVCFLNIRGLFSGTGGGGGGGELKHFYTGCAILSLNVVPINPAAHPRKDTHQSGAPKQAGFPVYFMEGDKAFRKSQYEDGSPSPSLEKTSTDKIYFPRLLSLSMGAMYKTNINHDKIIIEIYGKYFQKLKLI